MDVLSGPESISVTDFQAFEFESKELLASSDEKLCGHMSLCHHRTSFWPLFPCFIPRADSGSSMCM